MARILVISYSDLARDSRLDRQIGFLLQRHEVVTAGLAPPAHEEVGFIDLRVEARGLSGAARKGLLLARLLARLYDRAYWSRRDSRESAARLEDLRADLVLANDVATLPLACRVAGQAPVVFDAHELPTAEWAHLKWWRLLMAPYVDGLLREYLPCVAAMTTVSSGIADVFASRFGISPVVVTNATTWADLTPTPVHSPLRIVHHGACDPQRRLELMVEAGDQLGGRVCLDLMLIPSFPRYHTHLQKMSDTRPWLRVLAPCAQRDIAKRCNDYDVGVFVLPPLNDNSLHALPNKLFEFVQARLAVVVGPSPEMAELVTSHGFGVVTDDFTPGALARVLASLTSDRIADYKHRSHNAAAELSSERNGEIVLDLVDQVLGASRK
jgi:hypothetical protein